MFLFKKNEILIHFYRIETFQNANKDFSYCDFSKFELKHFMFSYFRVIIFRYYIFKIYGLVF